MSDRPFTTQSPFARVRVDPGRPLATQLGVGHNRWHPELAPVLTVAEDEPFVLETIDSSDAHIHRASSARDVASFPMGRVHPLTGPVAVTGARPGDAIEIEILEVTAGPFGSVAIGPGEGLLPELLDEPILTIWEFADGAARCAAIPGVTIPAGMFPGTLGVAPSWEEVHAAHTRETGGLDPERRALEMVVADAAPNSCADGLRTIPPRRNGGNLDVRQLGAGARLVLEAQVPGALISVGDLHYAQGEGELAASAIEMAGAVTMSCRVHRAPTWRGCLPLVAPAPSVSRPAIQTLGVGRAAYGAPAADALGDAARQAAQAMLQWLAATRGLDAAQGYVVLSAAADLSISQLVNDPNPVVSASLPLDIFDPPVDHPLIPSGGT